MHLGRASGRIPAGVPDPGALTPRAAWARAVVAAREHGVQALVLAGDVVDSLDDRFEAFGALHDGVAALLDAGIRVLAVAGNHDGVALPRLADLVPRFELIGRDGRWQTADVTGPGGPVRVVGWSFPGERYPGDPTAGGLPERALSAPTVGLLHCDLDHRASVHAPTPSSSLRAAGYDAWLLGHQHAPTLDPATLAPGYLGSLVGLDPTETGVHGPWLLEAAEGRVTVRQLALAPLRWSMLPIDVSALHDPRLELTDRVLARLRDHLTADDETWGEARVVGVRLRLYGRTHHADALTELATSPTLVGQTTTAAERVAFIDDVALAVTPAHDLEALARSDTPPGVLARKLLALQAGEQSALLAEAGRTLASLDRRLGADPAAHTDDETRTRLLQAGYRLLDALLAQQRGADDGSA